MKTQLRYKYIRITHLLKMYYGHNRNFYTRYQWPVLPNDLTMKRTILFLPLNLLQVHVSTMIDKTSLSIAALSCIH